MIDLLINNYVIDYLPGYFHCKIRSFAHNSSLIKALCPSRPFFALFYPPLNLLLCQIHLKNFFSLLRSNWLKFVKKKFREAVTEAYPRCNSVVIVRFHQENLRNKLFKTSTAQMSVALHGHSNDQKQIQLLKTLT